MCLFLLHLGNQHRAVFYHMIELSAILIRWMCWVLTVTCKMSGFAIVIKINLSTTSPNPYFSSSSMTLESSMRCTLATILRLIFHLHSIAMGPFHHQFVTLTIWLIVSGRFIEGTKQLLWCLNKILLEMTISSCMLPNYLEDITP